MMRPGGGTTVLWVAGYSLRSEVWTDVWDELPAFSHIGLDLPGHGRSGAYDPSEGLSELAQRINAFSAARRVRHVVGLSFGAMVVLQMVLEDPHRFDSVTLASAGLTDGPYDPQAQACHLDLVRLYRERGPGKWIARRWSVPPIFAGVIARPAVAQRVFDIVAMHSWAELRLGGLRCLMEGRQDLAPLLWTSAALLILVGEDDMPANQRCAELIRRACPSSIRRYVLAGHLCLLEEPAVCAAIIGNHLNSTSARQ